MHDKSNATTTQNELWTDKVHRLKDEEIDRLREEVDELKIENQRLRNERRATLLVSPDPPKETEG